MKDNVLVSTMIRYDEIKNIKPFMFAYLLDIDGLYKGFFIAETKDLASLIFQDWKHKEE